MRFFNRVGSALPPQDAYSAKIKVHGNDAFRKGDYHRALVIYWLCGDYSGHDPIYPLNSAAACLKLRCYEEAESSCTTSLERDDTPKAYFRRAQARRLCGKFEGAREDIDQARHMAAADALVLAEEKELTRIEAMDEDARKRWVEEQGARVIDDIWTPTEYDARVTLILSEFPPLVPIPES